MLLDVVLGLQKKQADKFVKGKKDLLVVEKADEGFGLRLSQLVFARSSRCAIAAINIPGGRSTEDPFRCLWHALRDRTRHPQP